MLNHIPAPSRILDLFAEHCRIQDAAAKHVSPLEGPAEDAELEAMFWARADLIAAEMCSLPCTSAADFAAKVIVETVRGSVSLDWQSDPLWAEARALVGIETDG